MTEASILFGIFIAFKAKNFTFFESFKSETQKITKFPL